MDRSKIPESYYQPGKILPRYLTDLLCQILVDGCEPIDISKLINKAISLTGNNTIEFIQKKLYLLAKIEVLNLCIAEYPSFKLRSFTKFPDFSGISQGIKYISSAAKILFTSREYIDVREIVKSVEDKKLYQFPNLVPEYWMYFYLNEYKEYFSQRAALKIGLKEWRIEKDLLDVQRQNLLWDEAGIASHYKVGSDVTPKMHEANLESIVVEHLDKIEEGLRLIKRQYICPGVGRIDVLCQDCFGDLVVIELKKFGVKHDSIVDQVARYMGYIKTHLAKQNQKVRGMLVVAKADQKLRYAVAAFPNIEIKTFNISIG
jgi:hypothetical protein